MTTRGRRAAQFTVAHPPVRYDQGEEARFRRSLERTLAQLERTVAKNDDIMVAKSLETSDLPGAGTVEEGTFLWDQTVDRPKFSDGTDWHALLYGGEDETITGSWTFSGTSLIVDATLRMGSNQRIVADDQASTSYLDLDADETVGSNQVILAGINGVFFIADTNNNSSGGTAFSWRENNSDVDSATEIMKLAEGGQFYIPGHSSAAVAASAHLNAVTGEIQKATSSLRYKNVLRPMTKKEAMDTIMGLRPIMFNSTLPNEDPEQVFLGLGAEDVAQVNPSLVELNRDGEPETVFYGLLTVPLALVAQDHERRLQKLERQGAP